jgi:hypothetical protein
VSTWWARERVGTREYGTLVGGDQGLEIAAVEVLHTPKQEGKLVWYLMMAMRENADWSL